MPSAGGSVSPWPGSKPFLRSRGRFSIVGAGIREAVLYATSGLTKSQSVFTAVTARMAFVLVDVLGAAICAPLVRRRTRVGATVGPLPTADDEPQ